MCIAALVLGIVSILGAWFTGLLGLIPGIIGIILAVVGRQREPDQKNIGTAGLVCSIIGVILGGILLLACGCTACAMCSLGVTQ